MKVILLFSKKTKKSSPKIGSQNSLLPKEVLMFFMLFFFFFSNYIHAMEVPTEQTILEKIKQQTNQRVIDWSSPETTRCVEALQEQGEFQQDLASLWEHREDLKGLNTKAPRIESGKVLVIKNLETMKEKRFDDDWRSPPKSPVFLDNEYLVLANYKGIKILNTNGEVITSLLQSGLHKLFCALSKKKQLLFAFFDFDEQISPIYLLNVSSKDIKILKKLSGHTNGWKSAINDLVHYNEELCASASDDKTVKIWDLQRPNGQECISDFKHGSSVLSVCFDRTGRFLFSGTDHLDGALYIWNLSTQELWKKIPDLTLDRTVFFGYGVRGLPILHVYCSNENDSLLIKDGKEQVKQCNPDLLFLSIVAENYKKRKETTSY